MKVLPGLFLICILFACKQPLSAPAPKMASDQFDSLQVEVMQWRDSTREATNGVTNDFSNK